MTLLNEPSRIRNLIGFMEKIEPEIAQSAKLEEARKIAEHFKRKGVITLPPKKKSTKRTFAGNTLEKRIRVGSEASKNIAKGSTLISEARRLKMPKTTLRSWIEEYKESHHSPKINNYKTNKEGK